MTGAPRDTSQLPLDLDWPRKRALGRSDFIESPANAKALAMIDGAQLWPESRLALFGPEGCGKTHLAAIWARRAGAAFVDLPRLRESNVRDVAALGPLVVEDFDRFPARSEERDRIERGLHHLYNVMGESGTPLLFTGREPPTRWKIDLPDLASRLSALPAFEIEGPDDILMSRLVLKLFDDRSISVDPRIGSYIALRGRRSYRAIAEIVETLDAASVRRHAPITVQFVKDVMEW